MVLLYVTIMCTMLCGFVSLGVDFGRVQVAKTELERAVFAASRAGAAGIVDGTASAKAIQFAAANLVDGTPLVLQNADVVVGTWTPGTGFSAGGPSPNAVQVNAYRTATRGTAIPLLFAKVIGINTCDIKLTGVVATATSNTPVGFTGLNAFPVNQNLFAASYNSAITTSPSHASYNSNGVLRSNGVLGQGAITGCWLHGDATVGSGGSMAGGINVTGTVTTLAGSITAPAVIMQVVANPGGVSQTPNLSNNTTVNWSGGIYYFTSLTVADACTINFTGPATVYLNGSASLHNNNILRAYNGIPANLMIYHAAGNTFIANDTDTLVAVYNGPGSDLTFHNGARIEGAMVAKTITLNDNNDLYYDEALRTNAQVIGTMH